MNIIFLFISSVGFKFMLFENIVYNQFYADFLERDS